MQVEIDGFGSWYGVGEVVGGLCFLPEDVLYGIEVDVVVFQSLKLFVVGADITFVDAVDDDIDEDDD